MADFNLIKIDGKPLEKLLEVISRAVGTIYRPRSIKNDADATAYATEVVERAKAKSRAEGKEIETGSLDRIEQRLIHQESKRQKNIESVSLIAAEHLRKEKVVSEEPVNEDWATRFFNIAKDVSDEEMQQLWGKIIAGEVKQPKSFSLRTMEVLRNLTREDANIFNRIAPLVLAGTKDRFVFNPDNGDYLSSQYGIPFKDMLVLSECGLIYHDTSLGIQLASPDEDTFFIIESIGKGVYLEIKKSMPNINVPGYFLTASGIELLKLIDVEIDLNYIQRLIEYLSNKGVKASLCDFIHVNDERIPTKIYDK